VAAAFLGRGTGRIGRRENRGHILVVRSDRHDADTRAEAEDPVLPGEAKVAHALAQRLRGAHRLIERAALEENAELIAAKPRKRVAPAALGFQRDPYLPQERVSLGI